MLFCKVWMLFGKVWMLLLGVDALVRCGCFCNVCTVF
jgi:hypothetical protein